MSGLLSPAEVVARLGVSRQTLARWEKTGQLIRDGSTARPRYREADVQTLAEARAGALHPNMVIVRAAAALLQERGIDGCTLEAVAERARLSRAGLAYHHPTKEHLLEALVRRFVEEFEAAWRREALRIDPGPGRLCRAYAAVTLRPGDDQSGNDRSGTDRSGDEGLGAAALACALDSQPLRDLVSAAVRGWYEKLGAEDLADGLGGDGVRTCLAADGLWLLALLHIVPFDSVDQRRALGLDRTLGAGRRPAVQGTRS